MLDSYTLGDYLEYEIACQKSTSIISKMQPAIEAVIRRCRDQAERAINLPRPFYDMGKLYLLLGKPYESLTAYTKAVMLSNAAFMIHASLESLKRLAVVKAELEGHAWMQRFLTLALAAKFSEHGSGKEVKKLATVGCRPIEDPVVIVAGGCDSSFEQRMQGYKRLLLEAFGTFKGVIISGGSNAGISELVGMVGEKRYEDVRTIGYIPRLMPPGVWVDRRYSEIRCTEGQNFSPLEPLQYWIDLVASGIPSSQVKLLGINGNDISATEYGMALALGARVAAIEGSGGMAAKLLSDHDWNTSKGMLCLPADGIVARTFLEPENPRLEPDIREITARAIYNNYRRVWDKSPARQDLPMAEWDELPENLKESNRQQADHIYRKLRQVGCTVHKVTDRTIALMKFTEDEIETMAEMEHARWVIERLQDGWKRGEQKDVAGKTSPYIVSWSELPDEMKEFDREAARKMPEFLAWAKLEIRR